MISGWFSVTALAIFCRIIVFPAFGGETMSPRCPFPTGARRSMIRVERSRFFISRLILVSG